MRVLFMGTPDFAVPCLDALLKAGHEICGVFTQPDKPKGRGYTMTPPPVKELALEHGLLVFQPKTLKTEEAAAQIRALKPEVITVVAYGKILPKAVLEIPPMGCINVHGSLLPKYRGAAPIQWAVINGEKTSGVTTMYMGEGLDTGDMLLKRETEIDPDETSGGLFDRLSQMGAELLVETLVGLEKGTLQREKQDDAASSYAPMLTKELCRIDWTKPAAAVHNQVRGLSPWPVANTVYQGKLLKIHQTRLAPEVSGKPGEVKENGGFYICCGDGAVELLTVQYEGSKRMPGKDFLRGHPAKEAAIIE